MLSARGVADPSTESLVDLANFCCRCLNIPTIIKSAGEVDAMYIVMVYKHLYAIDDDSIDPFHSLDDVSDRIRYIRDELSSVLKEDLDHIKVHSLIQGDTTAIFYLLEIIAAMIALWVFPKHNLINGNSELLSNSPPLVCSPEMPRSSTRACLPPPPPTRVESVLRAKTQTPSPYGDDCHKVMEDRCSVGGTPINCADAGGYQVWPSGVASLFATSPPATPREKEDHVEIVASSCSPKPPVTPPSPMHLCMLQSTDSGLRSSPRGDDSFSVPEGQDKLPSPQTTKNETVGPAPTDTGGGATSGIGSLKSSPLGPDDDNKADDDLDGGDLTGRSCTSLHTTTSSALPRQQQQEPPSGYGSEDDDDATGADRHRRSGTDSTRANALQPPFVPKPGCLKTKKTGGRTRAATQSFDLSSCDDGSENTSRTTAPSSFSFDGPSEGITEGAEAAAGHYSRTEPSRGEEVDADVGASVVTRPTSLSGISSCSESCDGGYPDEVFWGCADHEASSAAEHSTCPVLSCDVSNFRRNAKRVHRRALAIDDLARSLSSYAQDMCYRERELAKQSRQKAQLRARLVELRDCLNATKHQIDQLLNTSDEAAEKGPPTATRTATGSGRRRARRSGARHSLPLTSKCVVFAPPPPVPAVSTNFSDIEAEKRRLDRQCEDLLYAKQRYTAEFCDLILRSLREPHPSTLTCPIA